MVTDTDTMSTKVLQPLLNSTSRPSRLASRVHGPPATMPLSAPPCRSSASSCAKLSTFAPTRRCSTSLPATATPPSPPRGAGAMWSPPTTCRHCSTVPVNAPMPIGSASSSVRLMRRPCRFADGSFDVVVSTFGVMFTPDQDRAAAEMVRVCKRGGKIGLANWTPEGFIGQLFKTIGKHVPPPPGARSPALWGTRARMAELFEPHAASIEATRREFVFRYRSPEHWLETFKTFYGPVLKTFAALTPAGQSALDHDLMSLDRTIQSLGRRLDGGAQRIPRGRRHPALMSEPRSFRREERGNDAAHSIRPVDRRQRTGADSVTAL